MRKFYIFVVTDFASLKQVKGAVSRFNGIV